MPSERAELLKDRLLAFMDAEILPAEQRYHDELNALPDRFGTVPVMEELKAKAREAGLWNLWMPPEHAPDGEGLTNEEYAPLAEIMGRVLWAPEAFNYARWCRQADGPDQVHMMALGKQIVRRYAG